MIFKYFKIIAVTCSFSHSEEDYVVLVSFLLVVFECVFWFQAPEGRRPAHSHRPGAQHALLLLLVSLDAGKKKSQ